MNNCLYGIAPPLITPFTKDDKVDTALIPRVIDHMIGHGVNAIFALGSTGEFFVMNDDERVETMRVIKDAVGGRVPIIAGAGHIATKSVIALAKRYRDELGLTTISAVTPYYTHPSQDELIAHYERIATETGMDIVLYNIPVLTGVNLEPQTIGEIVRRCPSVIGLKNTKDDIDDIRNIVAATPDSFQVTIGSDRMVFEALEAGAVGAVPASAHVLPKLLCDIYRTFKEGKLDESKQLAHSLHPWCDDFAYGTNPAVVKAQLDIIGVGGGLPRMPIQPVSDDTKKILEASFKKNYGQYM